ncbi:MAG: hypothetical protein RSC45_13345 [Acinetobacter sp.]
MKTCLEDLLIGKEFDEELSILNFIDCKTQKNVLSVQQSSWRTSGKYLFESDMIVIIDDKYYRLNMEMFGNNPRDDYQHITVTSVKQVEWKPKLVYSWEDI